MLVLPFGARAENISGAMYTAPVAASNNHPAPTTQANAPYGRIDIDTTDQEHIATTAYVKGAYNSAIAAVNNVAGELNSLGTEMGDLASSLGDDMQQKQDKLVTADNGNISTQVIPDNNFVGMLEDFVMSDNFTRNSIMSDTYWDVSHSLVTTGGILQGIHQIVDVVKQVPVYTTWGNDNAKTPVALANITDFYN